MTSRHRSLALAAAIVVLAVGAWRITTGAPSSETAALQPPTGEVPSEESTADASALEEAPRAGERAVEAEGSDALQDPLLQAPLEREGVLSGLVLSEHLGVPLANATVVVAQLLHSEFMLPDLEERNAMRTVGTVTTDGEGRFRTTVPMAVPLQVQATAADHATSRRQPVFAGEVLELRLAEGASIAGTVTRASDGSPVEDVLLVGRDKWRVEQCRVRTGSSGTFLVEGLPPGLLTVEITPARMATPPSRRLELEPGQRALLDVALDPGTRIHGVVSDERGRPLAGAEVGVGASFAKAMLTDANGAYELLGLGGAKRRDLGDVRVRAAGHGVERRPIDLELMTEDTRIDFVLRPGRIATGRVVDPEGEPLAGAYVAGVGSKTVEGVSRSDWESTTTDAEGRFALDTLHTLVDHQLLLQRDGFGSRVYDFPADEGARGSIDYGDLVLHPGGRIEGCLRAQTGAPLVGRQVKLRGTNPDLDRFRPDAEPLEKTWITAVRHTRTDSEGRFHFNDLPEGELQVTSSLRGFPAAKDEVTVQLPRGGHVQDVELVLDLGDPITGTVLTPDGLPAIGVFIEVGGGRRGPTIRGTSSEGGRFELLGVTQAMGTVELVTNVSSYNWYHPDARVGASAPTAAFAGDTEVVLELRPLTTLAGRVEDASGTPLEGVKVRAYLAGTERTRVSSLGSAKTGPDGSFGLQLPEDCSVDLVADPPPTPSADEEGSAESKPLPPAILEGIPSNASAAVLRFEP